MLFTSYHGIVDCIVHYFNLIFLCYIFYMLNKQLLLLLVGVSLLQESLTIFFGFWLLVHSASDREVAGFTFLLGLDLWLMVSTLGKGKQLYTTVISCSRWLLASSSNLESVTSDISYLH